MRVVEFHDEAALQQLKPFWNELLRQSAANTIFLTWEWATAWWSSYGTPGELRVHAVYDEAGVLRGIAPLRSRAVEQCSQTVRSLQFIGYAASYSDSDYLDLIIAPGYE